MNEEVVLLLLLLLLLLRRQAEAMALLLAAPVLLLLLLLAPLCWNRRLRRGQRKTGNEIRCSQSDTTNYWGIGCTSSCKRIKATC